LGYWSSGCGWELGNFTQVSGVRCSGKVKKKIPEGLKEAFMAGAELYVELGRKHAETGSK